MPQPLAHDWLDTIEQSLSIESVDCGIGCFSKTTYLPRRVLPYALIARLENADVRLMLDDKTDSTVQPGQAFLVRPHQAHVRIITPHDTVHSSWAHLRCRILDTIDLFNYVHPPTILPEEIADLFVEFNNLVARPPADDTSGESLCRTIAKRRALSFNLLHALCDCSRIDPGVTAVFSHVNRLNPLLQHIHNHLGQRHSRNSLAERIHLSPSRLDSLFHETFGIGPVTYVIEQRMREAATLLVRTDHSIQHISRAVGYSNPFYFTRLFKKHTDMSPTAYRNAALQSHESTMHAE